VCLAIARQVLSQPTVPYNTTTAKYLLQSSSAAYSDDPADCWVLPSTQRVTLTFNNTYLGFGTFAYTAVDDINGRIILSYRGTDDAEELIEEALTSVLPVPFWPDSSLSLNAFFYGCEGLLYSPMKAELIYLMQTYPSYDIYMTGHSLGGAVAAIMAVHLVYDSVFSGDGNDAYVYTYGEPRVGDYAFAQKFDALFPNAYRSVHYKDIIAHLPPCHADDSGVCISTVDPNLPFLWAYHHGTEYWYQETMPDLFNTDPGSYDTCLGDPFGEDPNCSDGLLLKDSIDDHLHYFFKDGQPFEVGQACNT